MCYNKMCYFASTGCRAMSDVRTSQAADKALQPRDFEVYDPQIKATWSSHTAKNDAPAGICSCSGVRTVRSHTPLTTIKRAYHQRG